MSTIRKALPKTNDPHIGIEIEFDVPDDVKIETIKVPLESFHPSVRVDHEIITYNFKKQWGYEFTMCVPISDYHELLAKALTVLRNSQAYVDNRCGLHVHLDARYADAEEMRKNLADKVRELKADINDYRKHDSKAYDCTGIWPLRRYKTVEVRFMQATFDYEAAVAYIDKVVRISDVLKLHNPK